MNEALLIQPDIEELEDFELANMMAAVRAIIDRFEQSEKLAAGFPEVLRKEYLFHQDCSRKNALDALFGKVADFILDPEQT